MIKYRIYAESLTLVRRSLFRKKTDLPCVVLSQLFFWGRKPDNLLPEEDSTGDAQRKDEGISPPRECGVSYHLIPQHDEKRRNVIPSCGGGGGW
jgi:hypothetical protein